MENVTISVEEMIEFIYKRLGESISKDTIEVILDLEEEFLDSKGLIEIEEEDLY
ncbi:hypothetical protein [Romboutsia sp.]|uniref:hypothetical protein n=1 Tax=Romboutsia sp. TaxID=1965302 RepID=UPI003F3CE598